MLTVNDAFNAAVSHMGAGRHGEAEALFRRTLEAAPDHAASLMLLGVIAFHRHDIGGAVAAMRKALAALPAFSEAQHNLSVFLGSDGIAPPEQAIRAFLLRPDHVGAQQMLIIALRAVGRLAEAEALVTRYCAPPADHDGRLVRADLYGELGRFDAAAADYLAVLTLQPDHKAAYDGYRDVMGQLGHGQRIAARFAAAAPAPGRGPGAAPGADAANIYIKCYSRPMYLDRCLASIKQNLSGYGRIILLNDGIGPSFMAPLLARHPDVEVRTSPKVAAGIIAAPMSERLEVRKRFFRDLDYLDPGRFWVDEIARDPNDHVVVFEEDCWFFRPLAIDRAVAAMREWHILVYAMIYENATYRDRRYREHPPCRTVPLDGGLTIDLHRYPIDPRGWPHNSELFPIANTLFDKDYWLNSYEGILHWTDERHVLNRAARLTGWLRRHGQDPMTGCLDGGVVRHCQSSTARTDAGGRAVAHPIDPYVFNGLLNQLWLEGRLDVMAGYPGDLPEDYLIELMSPYLSAEDIANWRRWRAEFLASYWFYNQ